MRPTHVRCTFRRNWFRGFSAAVTLAMIVGATATASASEAHHDVGRGIELGARIAYGAPIGGSATDAWSRMVPVIVEAAYRFHPHFSVGASALYGVRATKACADNADCSSAEARFDLQLQAHLSPGHTFDPWIGVGSGLSLGFISTTTHVPTRPDSTVHFSTSGPEYVRLELGTDIAVALHAHVGPFISLSMVKFTSATADVASKELVETTSTWLMFGLRGIIDVASF